MNHFSESYKNNNSVFLSDLWIDEKIDNEIYYDVKYFTLSCQEKNIYYTFNGEQCQHLLENFRIPMRKADSWLFEANNNWNYIIYIYTNENIYRISGYPKSEEDEIFEIIPIF
jgi:hypothetical protein